MTRAPVAFAAVLLCAAPAHANDPLETFGFGARASGMAGAVTAHSSGAAAAHANPAAVAGAEDAQLSVGWGYGHMALELNGRDARVLDARGSDFGLSIPFPFGEIRTAFGLALYLPDQFVARIQLVPATEPHFVLLDNNVHRIVLEPVYSVRLLPWLSLGGGVTLLSDAAGNGIAFDVGVVGGERVGKGALDAELPTRAAPLFGILATPHPGVRVGATYRGEIDLQLQLDILADVSVPGVTTGDVFIVTRAVNYFTPQRATLGVAVDATPELTVTGDLSWLGWSRFRGGVPDQQILVSLGLQPPVVETYFPRARFHDVIAPRLGAEWTRRSGDTAVATRAGYAFEPSPVPDQVGLTSFADNARHILAAGVGLRFAAWRPVLEHPLELDLGVQWHHLQPRTTVKDQSLFPGQAFSSSGNIFRAALTLKVEL